MKDHLDGAMKIFEKYYEIGQDIIEKYELFNNDLKNHRVIQSLKNLNDSNEKVMKTLNDIINNTNLKNKINTLINIYEDDRKIYKERIEVEVEELSFDYGVSNGDNILQNCRSQKKIDPSSKKNNNLIRADKKSSDSY